MPICLHVYVSVHRSRTVWGVGGWMTTCLTSRLQSQSRLVPVETVTGASSLAGCWLHRLLPRVLGASLVHCPPPSYTHRQTLSFNFSLFSSLFLSFFASLFLSLSDIHTHRLCFVFSLALSAAANLKPFHVKTLKHIFNIKDVKWKLMDDLAG